LPVSGLRDWLQGYATDSEGKRFVASPANDNVITRDGWKLEYMSWQDDKRRAAAQAHRRHAHRAGAGGGRHGNPHRHRSP
jgi:outer membrane lipoprotein LolB